MNYKTIIYIATAPIVVLDSQVISLLKEIKDKQFFNRVILLAGVKKSQDWNRELSILSECGLEVILYRQYPNYNFYKKKQKKELFFVLKRFLTYNTIIHLRCESLTGIIKEAIDSLQYENVKILTDVRGAIYEETQFYNKFNPVQQQLKLYQHKKNIKSLSLNSDSVSCVSEKLREYVMQKTIINNKKVFVNHCIAGADFTFSKELRSRYRKKLGLLNEDIVFVFVSGFNAKWQNTEKIVNSISDTDYKLLNLSRREIKLENAINLFVPYKEVPNYLNAADIGMIWRNNDIVNNVASPIKFSEYVCCGLPVIANNGVCMINDYIAETGFGKIINNFGEVNANIIGELCTIDRSKIANNAKNKFSLEVIAKNYIEIYNKLLCGY